MLEMIVFMHGEELFFFQDYMRSFRLVQPFPSCLMFMSTSFETWLRTTVPCWPKLYPDGHHQRPSCGIYACRLYTFNLRTMIHLQSIKLARCSIHFRLPGVHGTSACSHRTWGCWTEPSLALTPTSTSEALILILHSSYVGQGFSDFGHNG